MIKNIVNALKVKDYNISALYLCPHIPMGPQACIPNLPLVKQ